MGFKTQNYNVKSLDIVVDEAYAQIDRISMDLDGNCLALFKIQTSRDNMKKEALEHIDFGCQIDKTEPIHKQIYTRAKEHLFAEWEDDIIE